MRPGLCRGRTGYARALCMGLNDAVTSALIALLRDDLFAAPFTSAAIDSLWNADASAALRRGHREPALRSAHRVGGVGTLATLFVLGVPVAAAELETALPSLGVDGAVELGLVERRGGLVAPLLDLRPHGFVDEFGPAAGGSPQTSARRRSAPLSRRRTFSGWAAHPSP